MTFIPEKSKSFVISIFSDICNWIRKAFGVEARVESEIQRAFSTFTNIVNKVTQVKNNIILLISMMWLLIANLHKQSIDSVKIHSISAWKEKWKRLHWWNAT